MIVDIDLTTIFVGRQEELADLRRLWDRRQRDGEQFVYVYFNAPGIGKTTLLNRFGTIVEKQVKGLHFSFVCTNEYNSRESVVKRLLDMLYNTLRRKGEIIEEYIRKHSSDNYVEQDLRELARVKQDLEEARDKKTYTFDVYADLLINLSYLVPIFYSTDEVQVFEQISLGDETLFHYYTRIIKAFLTSRILLVLSGTQYHILRNIGDKIGSPIRGKVKTRIISPLKSPEISAYCDAMRNKISKPKELTMLEQYLQTYSGGHPRTIMKMAEHFLRDFGRLTKISSFREFDSQFTQLLLPVLLHSELTSEKKQVLVDMQTHKHYEVVKKWLLQAPYNNMKLGRIPMVDSTTANIAIEDLVYDLMTTGIVVHNGDLNYYLTSYFHLLSLLDTLEGDHVLFLREVVNNRFFRLLVGSHAGLGYTFEHILLSSLIIGNKLPFPDISIDASGFRRIDGSVDLSSLEDGIYHTPSQEGIDIIIVQGKTLLGIQMTTMKLVPLSKLEQFMGVLRDIAGDYTIRAWFISLYHVDFDIPGNILLIAGDALAELIGEEIYRVLLELKENL